MEKSRKTKKMILIVLLLVVVALSIGFAAYSSTLTIQSSALVKGDPDAFSVVFSSSDTESIGGTPIYDGTYATGGTFEKSARILTDLSATFDAPNQTATWKVYAYNDGSFPAYLNGITVGSITCTAKDGTDQTKVDDAAKGIKLSVTVGQTYTQTTNNITGHQLGIGHAEEVIVTLTYEDGSAIADGNFDVAIGDITLLYESVD